MSLRPSKWALHAPIAVLPFLAALFLQGKTVHDGIAQRAEAALAAAGASWAKVAVDGRDVALTGDSPDEAQHAAALAAVRSAEGVRLVIDRTRLDTGS